MEYTADIKNSTETEKIVSKISTIEIIVKTKKTLFPTISQILKK
jgi:hypothetical protein